MPVKKDQSHPRRERAIYRGPNAERCERRWIIKIGRYRVQIEVKVGEIVFVAVAEKRLIRNIKSADFSEDSAHFRREGLNKKIFERSVSWESVAPEIIAP